MSKLDMPCGLWQKDLIFFILIAFSMKFKFLKNCDKVPPKDNFCEVVLRWANSHTS